MLQAEMLTRSATIQPQSFNEANRTVRVTWSTGAAVPRRDQHGPYSEVLSLDPLHVRLDRLRGASVLDSHQQRGLRDVIGVVDAAGVEAGAGWADVRFSSRPEVQPMVEDVKAGVIRHVSVGYSVQKWADAKTLARAGAPAPRLPGRRRKSVSSRCRRTPAPTSGAMQCRPRTIPPRPRPPTRTMPATGPR